VHSALRTEREPLAGDSWIHHDPAWLGAGEADRLLARLRSELLWEQREIELFGRRILQPRLIAWGGELPYRYSGQSLEPRALPPFLTELMEQIGRASGTRFNHVLANRYRDGNDSMGLHSDNEPELETDPVVASLSLGDARRFVLRPKKKSSGTPRELSLVHGALLVMGGACQRRYRHGVPRTQRPVGERISLTFRFLLRAPH
jgi:alkylated DNA repair dioxygenase AlkB